jgi:hypothetical protein
MLNNTSNSVIRQGVIYTGKISHFKDIFQSITSLTLLNVNISVEIWVNSLSYIKCKYIFHDLLFQNKPQKVTCQRFPDYVTKYTSKFYAILGAANSFDEILFMDADNIALRNIQDVFKSKEYIQYGAVLWPDIWSSSCKKETIANIPSGDSAFPEHVLWKETFLGLRWENTRKKAQEAEAGQIAIDLRRHLGLIDLGKNFY